MVEWASLIRTSSAPPSKKPSTAALTSEVNIDRQRSHSGAPGSTSALPGDAGGALHVGADEDLHVRPPSSQGIPSLSGHPSDRRAATPLASGLRTRSARLPRGRPPGSAPSCEKTLMRLTPRVW